jgi:DNA-binding response OmpR family regulator
MEDADDLRGALRLTLERRRLRPVLRPDGRSGLKALYELRPDAVVLDIGLPDIDGWEVLERIRDVSDVPVLLPERVKFAILRLRRKLGPAGERIVNLRGFGYRFG